MNSKERLHLVLNHKEADRVPIDFGATRSGGISVIAYNKIKELYNIKNANLIFDIQQQLVWPDYEFLDKFNIDVIDAGRAFLKDKNEWRDFILNDGTVGKIPAYHKLTLEQDGSYSLYNKNGIKVGTKPTSSLYFNQVYWPWKDSNAIPKKITKECFDDQLWAVPSTPYHLDVFNNKDLKKLHDGIKNFSETMPYALFLDYGAAGLFETPGYMRGLENWYCDMLLDKKGTEYMLDVYVEKAMEIIDRVLGAVSEYIDVYRLFHDDLGNQNNSAISLDTFRQIFVPRYIKLTNFIRSKTKHCKIMLHSCGSIRNLLPGIIEAGFDIINPVQISCADMDSEKLKKEFGNEITFWGGGCDAVEVINKGTPGEVKEHVKKQIDILAKDGGFVFCQTHNIQADVPIENVIAMLEAANEYGKY